MVLANIYMDGPAFQKMVPEIQEVQADMLNQDQRRLEALLKCDLQTGITKSEDCMKVSGALY